MQIHWNREQSLPSFQGRRPSLIRRNCYLYWPTCAGSGSVLPAVSPHRLRRRVFRENTRSCSKTGASCVLPPSAGMSEVTRKHNSFFYPLPPVDLAFLLLVLPEASATQYNEMAQGQGCARVIIKDRGGDHHQHQQGKTKVYTRHKPLNGVFLPHSPPWLLWGSYRNPPPYLVSLDKMYRMPYLHRSLSTKEPYFGPFVERDIQLKASHASSLPCTFGLLFCQTTSATK